MLFLRDAVRLITSPPGDLVYHLVTLFAIQLVLGIAFGHWNRNRRDPGAIRLLVTGAGLALVRALLMFIAVLDLGGVLSAQVIVPPLERLIEFAIILLVTWAFLPILQQYPRLGMTLLLVALVAAMGFYATSTVFRLRGDPYAGAAYNGDPQAVVWEFGSIVFLTAALVVALVRRRGNWGWLVWLLALWLAGHVAQVLVPFGDSDIAGWVRLTNLAGLPLLAGLAYRQALNASPTVSRDATLDLVSTLEAIRRIETGRDVETALRLAATAIARVVKTDMVGIGLALAGPAKRVRIVALHPPTTATLANQEVILAASQYPLLAAAFETGRQQRAQQPGALSSRFGWSRPAQRIGHDPLGTSQGRSAAAALCQRLGFEQAGPFLAQPLSAGGTVLGVMLIGNPLSLQPLTQHDERMAQAVGAAVAASLSGALRRETTDQSAGLKKARAEAQHVAERVKALEAELKREHQRSEELATKLRLREEEAGAESAAEGEIAVWRGEVRELAEIRAALEVELSEWKKKGEQLERSKSDLADELAQLQAQLQSQAVDSDLVTRPINGELGGIIVCDEEGKIILASQGAQNLLRRQGAGLTGTRVRDLFAEPAWIQVVDRLLDPNLAADDSAVIMTLERDGRPVQAELTRLSDVASWPRALAVMLYPKEASTPPSEMILSLVEELRTPMTSIGGYTDLLLNEVVGILGEMQRQFLRRVKANAERIKMLLDDLIRVTAIDAGQVSLSPEPVNMIRVIEDAIMSLSAQLSERDLTVQLDIPLEVPSVHADRDSLQEIMLNLLSNACNCSEPGATILVSARLHERGDQAANLPDFLLVSVTDRGGGVAPADQSRVFQRLYRADNPLIPGLGETGVGLSIAKTLVEAYGGRIWVESERDVGSTFSFILPLSLESALDPGAASEVLEGRGAS